MNAYTRTFSLALAITLGFAFVSQSWSATLVSSDLEARANDFGLGVSADHVYPSSLPYSHTHTKTVTPSFGEATYTLSSSSFRTDYVGESGMANGAKSAAVGVMNFNLASPANYTVTGQMNSVGTGDGEWVQLQLSIDGGSVLLSDQVSILANNVSFAAGGLAGDFNNVLVGSLTGTLAAGNHTWSYALDVLGDGGQTALTSASGFAMIEFTPIPEPSSLALLTIGATGLYRVARTRRARKLKLAQAYA